MLRTARPSGAAPLQARENAFQELGFGEFRHGQGRFGQGRLSRGRFQLGRLRRARFRRGDSLVFRHSPTLPRGADNGGGKLFRDGLAQLP